MNDTFNVNIRLSLSIATPSMNVFIENNDEFLIRMFFHTKSLIVYPINPLPMTIRIIIFLGLMKDISLLQKVKNFVL